MTAATLAEELRRLASLVRRLGPDRWDPEALHLAKDEAAHRLARVARRIEREEAFELAAGRGR